MIIAIKYNDDQHYSNELYSSIGGMECDELNELELELLKILNYKLHVVNNDFDNCINYLKNFMVSINDSAETDDLELEGMRKDSSLETIPSIDDFLENSDEL